MCETRFYSCPSCGTIVGMIHDGGAPLICCGDEMELLKPHTVNDEGAKTHLPHVTMDEYRVHVTVGDESHPMSEDHSIAWVYLQTDRGGQRKCFSTKNHSNGKELTVSFALADEHPIAVYSYCDKHGLWMHEV